MSDVVNAALRVFDTRLFDALLPPRSNFSSFSDPQSLILSFSLSLLGPIECKKGSSCNDLSSSSHLTLQLFNSGSLNFAKGNFISEIMYSTLYSKFTLHSTTHLLLHVHRILTSYSLSFSVSQSISGWNLFSALVTMSSNADEDNVLKDVTNSLDATTINPDNEAAKERVRNAEWSRPEKFDYDTYNADTKEKREAAEAAHEVPEWASNAARYEWSDEYGDVGPEFKDLEEVLFDGDNKVTIGDQYEKWVLCLSTFAVSLAHLCRLKEVPVTVESETKIACIRSASKFNGHLMIHV